MPLMFLQGGPPLFLSPVWKLAGDIIKQSQVTQNMHYDCSCISKKISIKPGNQVMVYILAREDLTVVFSFPQSIEFYIHVRPHSCSSKL